MSLLDGNAAVAAPWTGSGDDRIESHDRRERAWLQARSNASIVQMRAINVSHPAVRLRGSQVMTLAARNKSADCIRLCVAVLLTPLDSLAPVPLLQLVHPLQVLTMEPHVLVMAMRSTNRDGRLIEEVSCGRRTPLMHRIARVECEGSQWRYRHSYITSAQVSA